MVVTYLFDYPFDLVLDPELATDRVLDVWLSEVFFAVVEVFADDAVGYPTASTGPYCDVM